MVMRLFGIIFCAQVLKREKIRCAAIAFAYNKAGRYRQRILSAGILPYFKGVECKMGAPQALPSLAQFAECDLFSGSQERGTEYLPFYVEKNIDLHCFAAV